MVTRRLAISLAVASWLGAAACVPALKLDDSQQITCESTDDCPGGRVCDVALGLCVDELGERPNQIPSVSILGVEDPLTGGRPINSALISVSVVDPDQDAINLVVSYSLSDAQSPPPADWFLASTAGNTALSNGDVAVTWDLLEDASRAKGLTTKRVDTTGDGQLDSEVVSFAADVRIRVEVIDERGALGNAVFSSPIALGNDAPRAVLDPPAGILSGQTAFTVSLFDNTVPGDLRLADLVSVEVQFRSSGVDTWRAAALSSGEPVNLPTYRTETGTKFTTVWDSTAPSDDADPTVPQGVGASVVQRGQVRVRAADDVAGQTHYGPWSTPLKDLEVRNQAAPVVSAIRSPKASAGPSTGVIPIKYVLSDAQEDRVDINVEFSPDAGATWTPCTEYPSVLSEGVLGLATSALDVFGRGGVEHTFMWDSRADLATGEVTPSLRITAADALGASVPATTVLGDRVGSPQHLTAPPYTPTPVSLTASVILSVSDVDGDGYEDLILGDGDTVEIHLSDGTGGTSLADSFVTSGALDAKEAYLGYIDGDAILDLVVTSGSGSSSNTIDWHFGLGAGVFVYEDSLSFGNNIDVGVFAELDDVAGMDMLVIDGMSAITFWAGDGVGNFVAGACPFAAGCASAPLSAYYVARPCDLNGDGALDIAVSGIGDAQAALNLGGGTFGPFASLGAVYQGNPSIMETGDVNGDGWDDIVAYDNNASVRDFIVSLSNGDGTFRPGAVVDFPGSPVDLHVFDLNGDGRKDVFIHGNSGFYLAPSGLEQASLNASVVELFSVPNPGDYDRSAVGNFADGNEADLYMVGALEDFWVASAGSLPPDSSRAVRPLDNAPALASSRFLDIDRDGLLDVVDVDDILRIYSLSSGDLERTTSYALRLEQPLGQSINSYDIGDINGDGLYDIVIAGGDQNLILLIGESTTGADDMAFSMQELELPEPVTWLLLDDLTKDGRDDLVATVGGLDLFAFASGEATPPYFSINYYVGGNSPGSPVVGDWDGDGNLDVGMPNGGSNAMEKLLGDGAGGFTNVPEPLDDRGAFFNRVDDLNGDGVEDMAWVSTNTANREFLQYALGNPGVVLGGGDGTFGTKQTLDLPEIVGTAARGRNVAMVDISGDGVLDLLVTQASDNGFTLYVQDVDEGLGTGTFLAPVLLTVPSSDSAAHPVDVFGDGDLDWLGTQNRDALSVTFGAPFDVRARVPRLVGTDTWDFGTSALGQAQLPRVGVKTFNGLSDGEFAPASARFLSFHSALRRTTIGAPGSMVPLTRAWSVTGDVELRTEPTLERVVVRPRFGAVDAMLSAAVGTEIRTGLDASAPSPRAVSVSLPMEKRYRDLVGTAGYEVRVFARLERFQRSYEVPGDAAYDAALSFGTGAAEAAHYYLPRVPGLDGPRDVYRIITTWEELPRAMGDDLSTGTGRRFAVDGDEVRIVTDRRGAFQAFVVEE